MIRFGIAGFGLHAVRRLMPGFALARNCKVVALSRRDAHKAREAGHPDERGLGEQSGDVEAAAVLTLEFQRGTLATVLVSTRAHYRTPLEIVGDAGVLRAHDALSVEGPINLELWREGRRVAEETRSNQLAYARQADSFAAASEGRELFPAPGQQGWQNQLILDAAYRSLSSGKSEEIPMLADDPGR